MVRVRVRVFSMWGELRRRLWNMSPNRDEMVVSCAPGFKGSEGLKIENLIT